MKKLPLYILLSLSFLSLAPQAQAVVRLGAPNALVLSGENVATTTVGALISLSRDGHAAGQFSATNSGTVTLTTTNTNDIIVVSIFEELDNTATHISVASVSDTAGLSWQKRSSVSSDNVTRCWPGNSVCSSNLEVWWAYSSGTLSADVITVTTAAPIDDASLVAFGVTGADTASPWDTNGSLPAQVAGPHSSSIPTVTGVSTTNADTLLLGFAGDPVGNPSTNSAGSGYAIIDSNANAGSNLVSNLFVEDKIVSSAQSTISIAFGSALDEWLMIGDAIKQGTARAAGVPTVSNDLVGYWPLDGAVTNWATGQTRDLSGAGNTGQLISMSTTTSPVLGKIGQAFNFNGSSNYINMGDVLSVPNGSSVTVAFWGKINSLGTYRKAVSRFTSDIDHRNYDFGLNNANKITFVYTSGTDYQVFESTATFTEMSSFHHYVVTYTFGVGSSIRLYRDGVAVAGSWTSNTGDVSPNSGTGTLYVGGNPVASEYWSGPLDDVRVYKKALTATQVQELYNAGAATVGHASAAIPNGLVGYWPMDGSLIDWNTKTTRDISGSGYTATTATMGTTTTPARGKIGQALRFPGGDSVGGLTLPNISMGTTFTYVGWIYPFADDAGHYGNLLTQGHDLGIWLVDQKVTFFNDTGDHLNTTSLTPNQWHHVVVVNAGGNITFYLDGKADGTAAGEGRSFTATGIGCDDGINGECFFGYIDDTRIYNRALSANEVQQLYSVGATTLGHTDRALLTNGLITYWTFDGPTINWSGPTMADVSGAGNTGTLTSLSAQTAPVAGKIGQGFRFDGSMQYVAGSQTINTPTATVAAWVRFTSNPSALAFIVGFVNGIGAPSYDKDLLLQTSGAIRWYLYDGDSKVVNSSTVVTDGKWHYVVGTADGTTARLYIDGTEEGSTPVGPTEANYTTGDIFVNGGSDVFGPVAGSIDDVRIYNRALSAAEVMQLYNASR